MTATIHGLPTPPTATGHTDQQPPEPADRQGRA